MALRKRFRDMPGQMDLFQYLEDLKNEKNELKQRLAEEHIEWAKNLVPLYVQSLMPSSFAYDRSELEGVALYGLAVAINKYDSRRNASFRTFASKVIRNELYKHIRKFKKSSSLRLEDCLQGSIDLSYQKQEEKMELLRCFSSLEEKTDSQAIKKGFACLRGIVKGIPIKQQAKEMGLSETQLYRYVNQARKALQEEFEREKATG